MSTPISGIGTVVNPTDSSVTTQNTVNQSDFIKLFLAQLQFQDPLQPVDNQEFLAQLAQFSNLEQTQQTADNTNGLLVMTSSAQALTLLNKFVEFASTDGTTHTIGSVSGITFDSSGPMLSVTDNNNQVTPGVRLSQITTVSNTTITPPTTTP
jgi:flagellar basal-body rod modification protein FlgD